ncbi:sulfite exporter TauE/SafE family protein [Lutibacter holmesii]|uniref:Sulfite exporter TauE/SafE family protein n=1 Tax=Lutibacter holmesii TaxID=1137985 RepID=A0ABW3WR08_9FLAO
MEVTFPLFAGIIAALVHVISGPDHLAAVAPFAIESKREAWKVGLFWGFGHIFGMLSIGVLFLFFKELIPVEKISTYSEQFVGVILVFLGVWVLFKVFKNDEKTISSSISQSNKIHTYDFLNARQGNFASLSVGFVHGLAGVAHFLLFLPVVGFASNNDSVKYIIGFAIGTLIAMIVFAMFVGSIAAFSKPVSNQYFFKGIRLAVGLFALVIGVYWVLAN